MEVSETKLVNFAEKTKFDVSNVVKAPPPPVPTGLLFLELDKHGLELVNPDLSPLLGEDGVWTRNKDPDPTFRFKDTKSGNIYASLAEVPGLKDSPVRDITNLIDSDFVPGFEDFLGTLNRQNTEIENIFHLDPNQFLSRSESYKVLLRRPLRG